VTSIADAIFQLTADLESSTEAKEGTTLWWRRRALAHGMTLLQVIQQNDLEGDPAAAEMLRRPHRKAMVTARLEKTLAEDPLLAPAEVFVEGAVGVDVASEASQGVSR